MFIVRADLDWQLDEKRSASVTINITPRLAERFDGLEEVFRRVNKANENLASEKTNLKGNGLALPGG